MNTNGFLNRQDVINALETIKQEWIKAADGQPLDQIEGSIGLLLDDIVRMIDIHPEEMTTKLPVAD